MSYSVDAYYGDERSAAHATSSARAGFIKRTYLHLAGAILAFAGLEAALLSIPGIEKVIQSLFGHGFVGMLVLVVAFIGVSYLANHWALNSTSRATQYAGLIMFVALEAVIFLPILYVASTFPVFANQHLIAKAGLLTLGVFLGLTSAVFISGKDFSFLGTGLCVFGWLFLAGILGLALFGVQGQLLSLVVAFVGLALASGYVVYDTSNVIHRYRTDQHVAAALALFASVAMMFWYILRILMSFTSRD